MEHNQYKYDAARDSQLADPRSPAAIRGEAANYSAGLLSKSPDPESASPIRDRVSSAEQSVQELHAAIEGLEKRLDVVLTPQPPQPATNGAGAIANRPTSHLHDRIDALGIGTRMAIQRLHGIIDRIEL